MWKRCVYFFLILISPLMAEMKDRDTFFHHLNEGKKYFDEDDYLHAIQELSVAILMMEWTCDFSELSPYTLRGNVYFIAGDHESAIRDYSTVIHHVHVQTPENIAELIKALCGRCFCYGFIGNEDACNRDFKQVGEIFAHVDNEDAYKEFLEALDAIEFRDDGSMEDEEDNDEEYSIYWIIKSQMKSLAS